MRRALDDAAPLGDVVARSSVVDDEEVGVLLLDTDLDRVRGGGDVGRDLVVDPQLGEAALDAPEVDGVELLPLEPEAPTAQLVDDLLLGEEAWAARAAAGDLDDDVAAGFARDARPGVEDEVDERPQ